MASPPSSPSIGGLRSPPAPEGPKESVIARLIIAPLTFISFLLSLALIDSQNHAHRTNSHQIPPGRYSRAKGFFHPMVYKPVKSPYAYVQAPERDGVSGVQQGKGEGEGEEWYWHTQQRKMMKAEVADAFRVRNWVVFGLVLFLGVLGGGVYGVSRWIFGLVSEWL